MKLGLINSAWAQAGKDTAYGIRMTKEIGFDSIDIFADRAGGKSARERIVTAEEIIAREPNIIIGSWCGKKFRAEKVAARPGFERIPAVRNAALYEIKSPIILQPGPAALTEGLRALQTIMDQFE